MTNKRAKSPVSKLWSLPSSLTTHGNTHLVIGKFEARVETNQARKKRDGEFAETRCIISFFLLHALEEENEIEGEM